MDKSLRRVLQKQHYGIVGEEAAVKTCHWLKEKLLRGRSCYKETFYGIECHRCLQMTPTVTQCTHNCLFCWRYQGFKSKEPEFLPPEELLEKAVAAQRELITGFKGDSRVNLAMWEEATKPT
ncbi:MAG TPA: 4-demethylwyosine synthase TYW1, partial [Euryarchaeota archaeon]|nr:4-demethylwyosine synthase TYW1 [Euryarchaeota archaeon]